jgi:peptidoglycan/LPS O-acetylase OafA/YrhL
LSITEKLPISFFTAESFWLVLFFITSGYLLAITAKNNSAFDYIKKCATRFIRLAIPVFCASGLILLLSYKIGFRNQEVVQFVDNSWITSFYKTPLSLFDLIKEPFRVLIIGGSKFNSPYWVLKDMLFASLIIYFFDLIRNNLSHASKAVAHFFSILAVGLFIAYYNNDIISGCLCGALIGWYDETIKKQLGKIKWVYYISVVLPVVAFLLENKYITWIAFSAFILSVSELKILNRFFSCRFSTCLGKISFGVYSFHWPIFCSIGLSLFICYYGSIDKNLLYILMMGLCFAVTIALSFLFNTTIERWTSKLIAYIKRIENKRFRIRR